jgi:hypothetical protein
MRWLRRRHLLWLPLVLVLGAAYFLIPIADERINQKNCDNVHSGMKRAEVEAILGPALFFHQEEIAGVSVGEGVGVWSGRDGSFIKLQFDIGRCVCFKEFVEPPSPWDRFKTWVGYVMSRF